MPTTNHNRLLASLPAKERNALERELIPVVFSSGRVLHAPGEPFEHVYFPRTGVQSLLLPMQNGAPGISEMVEVAMVGNEGMLGVQAITGKLVSPFQVVCQTQGDGLQMKAGAFQRAVQKDGAFSLLVQRYLESLLLQLGTSTACARLHTPEQRLARWLLMIQDRVDGTDFVMTQEALARMLGIRRAGVNAVATALKQAGHIRYSRGKMTIVNRAGLETMACPCYHTVKSAHDELANAS